jgi:hypothetical protein
MLCKHGCGSAVHAAIDPAAIFTQISVLLPMAACIGMHGHVTHSSAVLTALCQLKPNHKTHSNSPG